MISTLINTGVLQIRYPGILLGGSYNDIHALADFICDIAKYQQSSSYNCILAMIYHLVPPIIIKLCHYFINLNIINTLAI